jgi:hypothetical protein
MKDEDLSDKVGSFFYDKLFVPIISGILTLSEYFAVEGYEIDEFHIHNRIIDLQNEKNDPFFFMNGGNNYSEIYLLERELENKRRYNAHKDFL